MRRGAAALAALWAAGGLSTATAAPAPDAVAAMIRTASESGDAATLAAVVNVAKQANPDSAAEIDALVASLAPQGAAPAQAAGESASTHAALAPTAEPPAAEWKGSVELGGSLAQGASTVAGAYGVVDVSRAGPVWSQRATFRGDYQQTDGRTTTDRMSLAYEPRVRLSPDRYAFGLAQFEHDAILGYGKRYTVGAGLGLQVANRPDFKLAFDFGPALRLTESTTSGEERAVAGRGSLNIRWLPTDRVTISQESAVYAEQGEASAKSITSLETLLFGPLKARLSYNLQYERNTPATRSGLDTTTRAAILYTF